MVALDDDKVTLHSCRCDDLGISKHPSYSKGPTMHTMVNNVTGVVLPAVYQHINQTESDAVESLVRTPGGQ